MTTEESVVSSSPHSTTSLSDHRDALRQRLKERLLRCEQTEQRLRASMDHCSSSSPKSPRDPFIVSQTVSIPNKTPSTPKLTISTASKPSSPKSPRCRSPRLTPTEAVISDSARSRAAIHDEKRRRKQAELEKKRKQEEAAIRAEKLNRVMLAQKEALKRSPKRKMCINTQNEESRDQVKSPRDQVKSPRFSEETQTQLDKIDRERKVAVRKAQKASPKSQSSSNQSTPSQQKSLNYDPDYVSSVRMTLAEIRASKVRGPKKTIKKCPSLTSNNFLENIVEKVSDNEPVTQSEYHSSVNPSRRQSETELESEPAVESKVESSVIQSTNQSNSQSESVSSPKPSAEPKPRPIEAELGSDTESHNNSQILGLSDCQTDTDTINIPNDPLDQAHLLSVISNGAELLKYSKEGRPQRQFCVIVPEEVTIYYGKSVNQKTLKTGTITSLTIGNPFGIFIPLCFTLKLLGGDLMVLATEDEQVFDSWTRGIKLVLDHVASF
ncbi:hypothetical protein P9112_003438 [Eukaryota sp. TZLM1-RC]